MEAPIIGTICAEDRCPPIHCIWLEDVRTVWKKSRTTLLHSRESISIPVRIWLVNKALNSVEKRMNCANYIQSRYWPVEFFTWRFAVSNGFTSGDNWRTWNASQIFWTNPHLSTVWLVLVGGLRYVLTRDRMMAFCFANNSSVVHLDVFLVISYMRTHVVDTFLHQAIDRSRRHHTLQFTHVSHRSWFVALSNHSSEVVPNFPLGSGAAWLLKRCRCFLDSALTCISLEMRRDCNGKIISSSCRTPWHAVWWCREIKTSDLRCTPVLLLTCNDMTNRVLINDGAKWILQRDEQERENRATDVKTLYSMLAVTTSGRAKELVKKKLSERNGMIAFGKIRERFGKTAGVAKLSDVFQFQWTSPDSPCVSKICLCQIGQNE